MSAPRPHDVRRAADAWVWVPDDAESIEGDDFHLVRYADHFVHPVQVLRTGGERAPGDLIDDVNQRAQAWGKREVCWHVPDWARPDGLAAELQARGARAVERTAVLARTLDDTLPEPVAGIDLRQVTTLDLARAREEVNVAVFGGELPNDDWLAVRLEFDLAAQQRGETLQLLAHIDGQAVGSAGCTVAGPDLRLWGGGVLEEFRGRGVYRALLAERLRWGRASGARLAIVKGRVETSAPILTRLGFTAYGEQVDWVLAT